ncbi:hypothetical protein C8R44DRAFT_737161 [Mycena epipterygia]|nr:hypothetical protein C8R44DRAFT_737161 [Mycena epipterygia]
MSKDRYTTAPARYRRNLKEQEEKSAYVENGTDGRSGLRWATSRSGTHRRHVHDGGVPWTPSPYPLDAEPPGRRKLHNDGLKISTGRATNASKGKQTSASSKMRGKQRERRRRRRENQDRKKDGEETYAKGPGLRRSEISAKKRNQYASGLCMAIRQAHPVQRKDASTQRWLSSPKAIVPFDDSSSTPLPKKIWIGEIQEVEERTHLGCRGGEGAVRLPLRKNADWWHDRGKDEERG